MKPIHVFTSFAGVLSLLFATQALSGHEFTLGAWYNYANENDNLPSDDATANGEFGNEALILYADGVAEKGQGNWSYSAELRVGPGSFTDTDNNGTGKEFALHKAWIGFDFANDYKLIIGKSQVPFGWKTTNFWPGDMFLGGYGDQMDVGFKLEGHKNTFNYNLAYYIQDDWLSTSTDSTDDNRHWGSSTTYRKVGTFVADFNMNMSSPKHLVGVSLQSGKLEDLTAERSDPLTKLNNRYESDGDHSAAVLYYKGQFGSTFLNIEAIKTKRKMPRDLVVADNIAPKYETMRYAVEVGRSSGNWTYYLDATWADSSTQGNSNGMIAAYAPGIRYDYGPGWIYAEYLTQSGYIDRYADVVDDDYKFDAVYLSIDWYY